MSKQYKFIWLDDQPSRVQRNRSVIEAGYENLGSASMTTERVEKDALHKVSSFIEKISRDGADLVIVDHVFNDPGVLNTKGSSLVHVLRAALPSIPFVCVSAAAHDKGAFNQEELSEYTYLFAFNDIADDKNIELLYSIARDFSRCVDFAKAPQGPGMGKALLHCPDQDSDSLARVLPSEFKNPDVLPTAHRVARWILSTFLERPGYLYDELRVATMLGLSIAGFAKVQKQFNPALYTGAFATSTRRRWWVSAIHDQLTRLTPDTSHLGSELAGRSLEGVGAADYSQCWRDGTNEPPPDAVAFVDATSSEEVAVKSQYTKLWPHDDGVLAGFESRLMMAKVR